MSVVLPQDNNEWKDRAQKWEREAQKWTDEAARLKNEVEDWRSKFESLYAHQQQKGAINLFLFVGSRQACCRSIVWRKMVPI